MFNRFVNCYQGLLWFIFAFWCVYYFLRYIDIEHEREKILNEFRFDKKIFQISYKDVKRLKIEGDHIKAEGFYGHSVNFLK